MRWKREGFKQFAEDYAMFRRLLDRVRVDLVRVFVFSVAFRVQLTVSVLGQRLGGEPTKFQRVIVTGQRAQTSH